MALELAGDMHWIRAHGSELPKRYGGMYVAIHNKKVITADKARRGFTMSQGNMARRLL